MVNVRKFVGKTAREALAALKTELGPDAVVDGRGVVERSRAVGVADCDVMHAIVVPLVDRQNARGREAMDRGDNRRLDQAREGERHEVGLVMDQVELARAFEAVGDVQRFPHLGVEARILRIAARGNAIALARGL